MLPADFSRLKQPSRASTLGERSSFEWKNTCCWQQSLTAKQLLHGAKGRKTANTHPESFFGWALIGWAVGRSLTQMEGLTKVEPCRGKTAPTAISRTFAPLARRIQFPSLLQPSYLGLSTIPWHCTKKASRPNPHNKAKIWTNTHTQGRKSADLPFLVNLFLIKLVRISGFSSLFVAIAVFSSHFAGEC